MSKYFDEVKVRFNALDDEGKALAVAGSLFVLAVVILLLFLILAFIKAAFVPALIAVALYSVGVKVFNWPIPSFVKKLFK